MNQQTDEFAQKLKTLWVVVLAIALLAGGTLAWQGCGVPKKEVNIPGGKAPEEVTPEDEVINWKTYQSLRMEFSIKCPPDLRVFLDVGDLDEQQRTGLLKSSFSTETEVELTKEIKEPLMFMRIESWTGWTGLTESIWGEGFTFQDWIDTEIGFLKERWDPQLKKEDFILNNSPAIKTSHTKEPYSRSSYRQMVIIIYTQKGERMYRIAAWLDFTYLTIFDKMLSTFRFLD